MAATQLPVGLKKQDFRDQSWHTELDAGFDDANNRLTLSGFADPNGVRAGHWYGQKYWERTTSSWYTFVGPTLGSTSTWIKDIPTGIVQMFAGPFSSIPQGWALCDGSSGTPDLRDRFITGADQVGGGGSYETADTLGAAVTGGEDSVVLDQSNLPNVTLTSDAGSPHNHEQTASDFTGGGGLNAGWDASTNHDNARTGRTTGPLVFTENESAHTHPVPLGGSDAGHENRPQFYALYYIMKL